MIVPSAIQWWLLAGALVAISPTHSFQRTREAVETTPSAGEILVRVENEHDRRRLLLQEYSGSRQYTLQCQRFGKQAMVAVLMNYRHAEGERYTVLRRSGSEKLNGIINRILEGEQEASMPPENARHQINSANYLVRRVGNEIAAGRICYVLELTPKVKSRYLIIGKAWVDVASYAVVKIEGKFAAGISVMIGTPHITEDFIEVDGFWLPGHVRSVTSSFLLGPSELDIRFSNYQLVRDPALRPAVGEF